MTMICDLCDDPAEPFRPLVRVYDRGWQPLDVHEDCWTEDPEDVHAAAHDAARAAISQHRATRHRRAGSKAP